MNLFTRNITLGGNDEDFGRINTMTFMAVTSFNLMMYFTYWYVQFANMIANRWLLANKNSGMYL